MDEIKKPVYTFSENVSLVASAIESPDCVLTHAVRATAVFVQGTLINVFFTGFPSELLGAVALVVDTNTLRETAAKTD